SPAHCRAVVGAQFKGSLTPKAVTAHVQAERDGGLGAPQSGPRAGRAARAARNRVDRAAACRLPQPAARSDRGSGAGARMATRLLEASAAAVVGGGRSLSTDRKHQFGLSARAAGGGRLLLWRMVAGPRHSRRVPWTDRGARA